MAVQQNHYYEEATELSVVEAKVAGATSLQSNTPTVSGPSIAPASAPLPGLN